jgi:hypothetical protein
LRAFEELSVSIVDLTDYFLAEGIWKVHIFRHLFVCFQTRVSPVKRHLRPSNPQLTSPTLQIEYCYSLFNQIYHMKWTKPRPGRNWLHVFCGGINKLRTKTHNIKFGLGAGKMDPDQSNLLLSNTAQCFFLYIYIQAK